MNETPDPQAGQSDGDREFHRDGLRTLADMRRSSDDRLVAGVCAGVARHLNIDPIVVRIAVVALTFVGLAGLILYLAAWFLIPSDDDRQSIAADWFHLDRNEEQVRTIGLFVALVLAIASVVGDRGWGLWWLGWWVIPFVFLFWLFVVRPRRWHDDRWQGGPQTMPVTPPPGGWSSDPDVVKKQVDEYTAAKTAQILARRRARWDRRYESRALRRLTLSIILIAEAVALIVDRAIVNLPGTAFVAVALVGIAIGCLIGSVWGNAGGLIGAGIVLSILLAIHSMAPAGNIGQEHHSPRTTGAVQSIYTHGVGEFELDLSHVNHPRALIGRTVKIDAGIGRTLVYVPDEIPVTANVHLRAGEINAFGRQWRGRGNDVKAKDGDGRALHLVVNQRLGDVEVIRR